MLAININRHRDKYHFNDIDVNRLSAYELDESIFLHLIIFDVQQMYVHIYIYAYACKPTRRHLPLKVFLQFIDVAYRSIVKTQNYFKRFVSIWGLRDGNAYMIETRYSNDRVTITNA